MTAAAPTPVHELEPLDLLDPDLTAALEAYGLHGSPEPPC